MVVNMGKQEALQQRVLVAGSITEPRQASRRAPDLFRRFDVRFEHQSLRAGDQIARQMIEHVAQGLVKFEFDACAWELGIDPGVKLAEERNFLAKHLEVEEVGFESIV